MLLITHVFFSVLACQHFCWINGLSRAMNLTGSPSLQSAFSACTALSQCTEFDIIQWSSIGGPWAASGPLATYLLPLNCYSFTMCFGWVCTCIPGLVSMPTIHRQLGHSLLRGNFLTFTFVSEVVRYWHFAGCRSLGRKWRLPSSLLKEKWTVKIGRFPIWNGIR